VNIRSSHSTAWTRDALHAQYGRLFAPHHRPNASNESAARYRACERRPRRTRLPSRVPATPNDTQPARHPVFLVPGNYDDREALRKAFRDHRYLSTFASHSSYAFDAWPLRVIALDSTDPRHIGGYLEGERLAWFESELAAHPRRPTIIALHHPPFRTGVLMRPWNGTIARTAPSTSPQLVIGRSRLGIGVEAAGVLLREWNFNAEIRTYIARLESADEQQIA
jgi:3',5'-cyclic AMP phosphodiesterase CpdA